MAKRVYISPSDQVENKYAWGNTNEHVQCQRIAEAEAAALRRCGVEVQLAKFGTSMAQRCAESNAFGADIHNCVHTNAFNGKVTGTRLFCFAVPGVPLRFASVKPDARSAVMASVSSSFKQMSST